MSKYSIAKVAKVSGTLLLLFAIAVLVSQSLMDLFSTLLCLYLAFQWFQLRRNGLSLIVTPKMGFDWLWVVWFGVAALGFALNNPPATAPDHFWLVRLIEFKWILILYFMVGAFAIAEVKEKAVTWFNGAALFCSVYAIIEYYFAIQANPGKVLRLGGLYQFSMTYAHVYGLIFCWLFGLNLTTFRSHSKQMKALNLLTTATVGVSVLLTYTRSIWMGVIGAVITMAFLWRIRAGVISILALIVLATGLYNFVPMVKNRIDFTAKIANIEQAKDSYDNERVILWKTNLMIFNDHPLLGVGYGQNKFHLEDYYKKQGLPDNQFVSHAHNQYLHLLAGTGILGLLCYIGLLGCIAFVTLRAFLKIPSSERLHKGLALGSLGAQVCFFIGGITESNFEHSKVRFAIMFMWAMGLWLWKKYKNA